MASIADLVINLRRIQNRLATARTCLTAARRSWTRANTTYRHTLRGSSRPETTEIARLDELTDGNLLAAAALLNATESAVITMISRLTGAPTPATASPGHLDQPTTAPTGDVYPSRASWAVHLVDQPYSSVRSGVPVIGVVRAAKTGRIHLFKPTDGRWTDEAADRLGRLNAPAWARRTSHHVEMQVAAWMVGSGVRHAELVINREPCGERFGQGCHQAIQAFLPAGYRLSVSGTRGQSGYFAYDYEGRASS